MSTAQTIIDNGFAKSAAARPESMTVTPELLARINQCLREVFQVFKRENPYLIGARVQVAFNGSGWPRPSDAMAVIEVLADSGTIANPALTAGDEISVVPFDDQRFAEGQASLTELGQVFIPTGQTIDPSNGTVTIVYARAPITVAASTDSIDPLFPSFLDDYLQFDIAAYLATKDQRSEDESTFIAAKNALMGEVLDWARAQTYNLKQRTPITTPPLTNTNAGRTQAEKGG